MQQFSDEHIRVTLSSRIVHERRVKIVSSIKQRIERFQKYDLNDYHSKDYVTRQQGDEMCSFIIEMMEYIEALEEKIDRLENKE